MSSVGAASASDEAASMVAAAAHAVYLASERTHLDWSEFIETLGHAHAAEQHDVTATLDLPKNGVHTTTPTVGTAARFEALLDELYLTQGYRNSHHTRVAADATSGSSLVNSSMSSLRFLSATCYRSLKDLFQQHDTTLEAVFLQYRDLGGASNPEAYADFLHSLIALSQRWKRYVFFREDPSDYLRQSRALFGILDDYLAQRLITFGEFDFIENTLYNIVEDGERAVTGDEQYLLAAWANCWEVLGSGADDPTPAVLEFYESVLQLLERQIQLIYRRYTSEATGFLQQLSSNYNYKFAGATLKHLMSLIQHHARFEERTRRGDTTPLSAADLMIEKQSTLLFACFAESASSQNVHELIDSLQLIGNSWRKSSPHINLLECLRYVESNGLISKTECDQAELLVYERDAFVLAAWAIYEEADYSKSAFDEFIDSVRVALEREFRDTMAKLARDGYALVNSWSERPDSRPILHQDPLRDEVLGLQRARVDTSEFVLPPQVRGSLSAQHSAVVRSLLAARDPVLLALLAEFSASRNLFELLDGVERLIARELLGSASAVERDTESDEQALDVFQLSQMLLSLQNDGYLSEETLTLLLDAVQLRADPVLLAAFALYKESLQTDGQNGWPEMWDSLQRVYQRLQRGIAQSPQDARDVSPGTSGFISARNAVVLRNIGTELLDSLSASSSASAPVSITDTLYLRDLLRAGNPTLFAILSLVHTGEVNRDAEVRESLTLLGRRWVKELDSTGARTVRVLQSLAQAQFFTNSGLDYLLGLVYARDPTLAAAFSLYAANDQDEQGGTDSEYEEEDEEDQEYEDENGSSGSADEWQPEYEYASENEHKYTDPRPSSAADYHARGQQFGVSHGLIEFIDSLQHILAQGQATISSILAS